MRKSNEQRPSTWQTHTQLSLTVSTNVLRGTHHSCQKVPRRMHHSVLTSDSESASSAAAREPGRQGLRQRRGSASTPSAAAGAFTVPRQRGAPQWHGSISSPLNLQ